MENLIEKLIKLCPYNSIVLSCRQKLISLKYDIFEEYGERPIEPTEEGLVICETLYSDYIKVSEVRRIFEEMKEKDENVNGKDTLEKFREKYLERKEYERKRNPYLKINLRNYLESDEYSIDYGTTMDSLESEFNDNFDDLEKNGLKHLLYFYAYIIYRCQNEYNDYIETCNSIKNEYVNDIEYKGVKISDSILRPKLRLIDYIKGMLLEYDKEKGTTLSLEIQNSLNKVKRKQTKKCVFVPNEMD